MNDPTECSEFSVSDYSIGHLKTAGSTKCSGNALFMEFSELLLKPSNGHECSIHKKEKLTYTEIKFITVPHLLKISHEDNRTILVILLSYCLLNSNKKYT